MMLVSVGSGFFFNAILRVDPNCAGSNGQVLRGVVSLHRALGSSFDRWPLQTTMRLRRALWFGGMPELLGFLDSGRQILAFLVSI